MPPRPNVPGSTDHAGSEGHSYSLDDLHLNSRKMVQVSSKEIFLPLPESLKEVCSELESGSTLEKNMASFFQAEVSPKLAYLDNDVYQGKSGPRRLYAVGTFKKVKEGTGLFVRLGISAPDENPLIPELQVIYLQSELQKKFIHGAEIGLEMTADAWVYQFSDRYQGMVKGVHIRTRLGVQSLSVIPVVNEAILNGKTLETFDSPQLAWYRAVD